MKRIVSLLISLLLVSNTVFFISANADMPFDSSVDYTNSISLLKCLKIDDMSDSYHDASNTYVTRAEAVNTTMRCVIKGCGNSNTITDELRETISQAPYSDVIASDWYAPGLAAAKGMKVISDSDFFRPADNITYDEFAKVVVSAAGYYEAAEQRGGYPAGYRSLASRLDLFDNVQENGTFLTKSDFVIILCNLLKCAPMIQTGYDDTKKYEVDKDETFLSEVFDIYFASGKVITTSKTSLTNTDTCDDGYVVVKSLTNSDSQLYLCNLNIDDYLGRSIDFWFKDEGLRFEIISVSSYYDEDDIVRVSESEIEKFSRNDRTLEYKQVNYENLWDSRSTSGKVKISKNCDALLNGVFCDDMNKIFDIIEGKSLNLDEIVIVDSDKNGSCDLINVSAYYTYMPSSVNKTNKLILDKYTKNYIDLSDDKKTSYSIYNGLSTVKMDLGTIDTSTVISVYEGNGDKKNYKIVSSKNKSKSVIDERRTSSDGEEFLIGGKWYKASNSILPYIDDIELGKRYNIFFDYKNKIAGLSLDITVGQMDENGLIQDSTLAGIKYGIVADTALEQGLDGKIFLKIYTTDGFMNTYEVSDKCTFEEMKFDKSNYGICVSQMLKTLVQTELDEEGKICKILKPLERESENSLSYCAGYAGKNTLTYKQGTKVFYGTTTMAIGNSTTIIKAPSDSYTGNVDTAYGIGSISEFENDKKYDVEGFYIGNKSVNANIMIYYSNSSKAIEPDAPHFIVESVVNSTNSQERSAQKIIGLYLGERMELTSAGKVFADEFGNPLEISCGDIVQVLLNSVGDCEYVKMIYDYDKPEKYTQAADYASIRRVVQGCVYKSDTYSIIILKNTFEFDENLLNEPGRLEIQSSDRSWNYVFEKGDNPNAAPTVRNGNRSQYIGYCDDPVNYDRVVITQSYGNGGTIVCYR